ncbi:hypothetical protein OIDMADRAFT_16380 [Oidiodendron maius Zn]|uniref:Uncharacterized protein n=1 Tax=Oidiodendron maius (strain Zn) TaxID=913774 RepID=A0A0C3E0P4_OIDMZ|nr:hypothetical protein OIDMADRAFT_16380 [Oidiodendron maius Zn]
MAIETVTQTDTVQSLAFPDTLPFPSDIPIAPLHGPVLTKLQAHLYYLTVFFSKLL